MIRRLDLHLLASFALGVFVCGAAFLLLFVLVDCFQHFDAFSKSARESACPLAEVILRYYLHQAPLLGYFLAPIVAAGASAAAVTRLMRENETVLLKASGVSLYRACLPLLVGSAAIGIGMACDQELLIPRVSTSIQENERASLAREEADEVWDVFRVDRYRRAFQIQKYDRRLHRLEHVTITQLDDRGVKRRIVYADEAVWETDAEGVPVIVLSRGTDYSFPEGETFGADPKDFGEKGLRLQTNLSERALLEREPNPLLLNSQDLESHLEGFPTERRTRIGGKLLTALHSRLPECLAPLFLTLLGIPLVLRQETRNYAWGMAVGLGGWVAFLAATQVCSLLGAAWILPPVVAAWIPLGLLAPAAAALYVSVRS